MKGINRFHATATMALGLLAACATTQPREETRNQTEICLKKPHITDPQALVRAEDQGINTLIAASGNWPGAATNTAEEGFEMCAPLDHLHAQFLNVKGEFWRVRERVARLAGFDLGEGLAIDVGGPQALYELLGRKHQGLTAAKAKLEEFMTELKGIEHTDKETLAREIEDQIIYCNELLASIGKAQQRVEEHFRQDRN